MSSVTCAICGSKKGGTNDWWVLCEAESGRAVWIGRIEDAENEHPWKSATAWFNLCGVECLYRKLNSLLLPQAGSEKPPLSLERPAGNLPVDSMRPAPEVPASRLAAPNPLRGILRLGSEQRRTGPDAAGGPTTALAANRKTAAPRLSENAAIGELVTISGLIQSDEPMSVNGELGGTLLLPYHRLTVGPSGKVRANVQAREVEVLGMLEGDIHADKVVVRKSGRLVGNICTATLVIEEGACFEGRITKAPGSDTGRRQRVRHAGKL
jgi:cytoskeletal protein CcmA (bactofilin family)